ncbi:MAG: SulP family inorganic anion transporter [Reyranella sp.]|nr:SulP family inorganic anion transporter [Reyranella sp.]
MTSPSTVAPSGLARWLPGLRALKDYEAAFLPRDLAAGLTLGAVMVPVGLAFGELAGAPLAGLYAGMLPLVAYALFGSSRQLIVGPDASMAAIVAVSVAPLAGGDMGRLALLAGSLAVLIGLICIAGGLLRLGFMADFLSKPVIVGFMHGLAVVIAVGQLPKVLGVHADGDTTVAQLVSVVRHLGETNLLALTIGVGCVAAILGFRRFVPRIPGQVVALVVSVGLVAWFDLERFGLAVVGKIPTGLPSLQMPALALADLRILLPVAFVAALVSFSDTMVTARGFASRNRYRVNANQELIAVGVGNIASGLTQGLPISASGSRTAVAEAAGSRTQVTSVVAAAVVCAAMLFLTDILYFLPAAALGGILIAAAWSLCDFTEFGRLWRFRGAGLLGALLTLAGVVGIGVMEGIAIGVLHSLVMVLQALAFPADAVLGRTPAGEFHDAAHHPDARPVPGVIVYRFSAPLFFPNCSLFREHVERLVDAASQPVHGVVLDGSAINNVDLAACETLVDLRRDLADRGIRLAIGNLRDRVRQNLVRGWPAAHKDEGLFFPTVADAVSALNTGAIR